MSPGLSFRGKVVLVSGSWRGIGAGISGAFGKLGARGVGHYVADSSGRNQKEAEEVAAAIPDALILQCNVGNAAEVAEMMSRIREKFGALDILVNNAGILRDRTIKKMSDDEWESVLRVNLQGAFHCIRAVADLLR